MAGAKTYAFNDVNASITGPGGSFNFAGAGSAMAEEGITISMIEDKSTMTIGADGTPMHSLHAGQGARISIRLLKTSPLNQQLSQLYNTQVISSGLHGQNVISIKNSQTGDSVTATNVAFSKFPDINYGKQAGTNTWEFMAGAVFESLGAGGATASAIGFVQASL